MGANEVITKDVLAYSVVAGNPSRIKKMRFDDVMIERLERVQWWRYAVWALHDLCFDDVGSKLDIIEHRDLACDIADYHPEHTRLNGFPVFHNILC